MDVPQNGIIIKRQKKGMNTRGQNELVADCS